MIQQAGFFEHFIPQYQTNELSMSDIESSFHLENLDLEMRSFDFSFESEALTYQLIVEEFEKVCDWVETESSFCYEAITEQNNLVSVISPPSSSNEVLTEAPLDNQVTILHLLMAYGEAKELKQEVLAEQILGRLREKASSTGTIFDRVAYYLVRGFDDQIEFLTQESNENYEIALKVFYQMFPFGRFVHFAANKVILEAIPKEAEIVHIIDFDIQRGIQWPSLLEELRRRGKIYVKLTSMKWSEDDFIFTTSQSQRFDFEETKRWLCEYARSIGLRFKVEEIDMERLVSEMKRLKKRGGTNEWLGFNCIVDLPHMNRAMKSFKPVCEFLKLAKDSISIPNIGRGVITFSEGIGSDFGEEMEKSTYGSFFQGKLEQVLALIESIERNFRCGLVEARIAIENLFIGPYVSSSFGFQKWEETHNENRNFSEFGLVGWNMSEDNLVEAKELVRERESLFQVEVVGMNWFWIIWKCHWLEFLVGDSIGLFTKGIYGIFTLRLIVTNIYK